MVDSLQLAVNFIFVSDHGMTKVDNQHTLPLPACIDTSKFIIPSGDVLVHLYAKEKSIILPTYQALLKAAIDYDVYLAEDVPVGWHYSKKDDYFNRIGDILLVPKIPNVFNISNRSTSLGKHGYDPAFPDMHASFYAWGPGFKKNMTIKAFENVHVYPLIAHLLDLKYSPTTIDGKWEVLKALLKD